MKESNISLRGKVIHGIRIRAAHEILYYCIKRLARKNGFCWAMNETLATLTGYTKGYVSHLLTDLFRIGWVYRRVEYGANGEVTARVLVPMDKLVPNVDVMARLVDELEKKNSRDANMNRLRHNGRVLGINPEEISTAVYQHGAERVDELLAIIYASNSCKSPRKFFYAGLKKVYLASKRAKRSVGTWFAIPKTANQTKWILRNDSIRESVDDVTRPLDSTFLASLSKLGGTAAATVARMSVAPTA